MTLNLTHTKIMLNFICLYYQQKIDSLPRQ